MLLRNGAGMRCRYQNNGVVVLFTTSFVCCSFFLSFAPTPVVQACFRTQTAITAVVTTTTTITTTTTTTTPVCTCPATTSGIISGTNDATVVQLNMPPASATCGGCPNGLIERCYATQASNNPNNDVADVDIQCANADYTNFCACPSDGSACYQVLSNTGPINDIQIFTFCDAGGCLSYLIFFGQVATDSMSNGATTVTFAQELDATQTMLVNMGSTSPYIKAAAFSVSCTGCNGISTNNAQSGTAVTCTGPLTTTG